MTISFIWHDFFNLYGELFRFMSLVIKLHRLLSFGICSQTKAHGELKV